MIVAGIAILIGLILLVWSSDRFVDGASALALNLGISPLVIGLTVVGFGTSAPEILVSAIAALQGNAALGVGNAIGSNIANIAMVLGFTALMYPLAIQSRIVKMELPLLIGTTIFGAVLVYNGYLSRLDGVLLLLALGAIMTWLVFDALKSKRDDVMAVEIREEVSSDLSLTQAIVWFVVGLIVLLISARILVWGAVTIAEMLGVSDLVIGLTIVAIGTSLPELAASIAGAKRGESDLVIGNIIGSNIFNLFGVMAVPGLIAPGLLPKELLTRDYPLMMGLTVVLMLMAFSFRSKHRRINRVEGGFLFALFLAYQLYLFSSVGGGSA